MQERNPDTTPMLSSVRLVANTDTPFENPTLYRSIVGGFTTPTSKNHSLDVTTFISSQAHHGRITFIKLPPATTSPFTNSGESSTPLPPPSSKGEMAEEDRFLALVHNNEEIKHRSREGVKFMNKNPTNVFITTRTRVVDLQRRICRDGRKCLGMIYYCISISVVAQRVKYDCFAIEADEDLQVLFHRRRQFTEVRTTKLFVEKLDPLASSGGSASDGISNILPRLL
ncbi:hypothetical protein PIB30_082409 [Stylosanthes scabra]|uniref:Uncharacterized protein n=1 Tax=Stylosanthes scabra TaxID=79078 RepID=A0ABU6YSK7_9FABA|nr:hypothetical protein [Stylosanthes scabra]